MKPNVRLLMTVALVCIFANEPPLFSKAQKPIAFVPVNQPTQLREEPMESIRLMDSLQQVITQVDSAVTVSEHNYHLLKQQQELLK